MNITFKGLTTKGEWIQGSLVITNRFIKHKPHQHTKTWIVQSAFGNGGWFNIMQRQYVYPHTISIQYDTWDIDVFASLQEDWFGGTIIEAQVVGISKGKIWKMVAFIRKEDGSLWFAKLKTDKNEKQILLPYMYHDFLHIKKIGVHHDGETEKEKD